jgi:hypothetical protein
VSIEVVISYMNFGAHRTGTRGVIVVDLIGAAKVRKDAL